MVPPMVKVKLPVLGLQKFMPFSRNVRPNLDLDDPIDTLDGTLGDLLAWQPMPVFFDLVVIFRIKIGTCIDFYVKDRNTHRPAVFLS